MQNTNYFANELSNLRPQIEQLNDRITRLTNRCDELREGARRRDWVLSQAHPGPGDIKEPAGKTATTTVREQLYVQLREMEKELNVLRGELANLNQRAREARTQVERQRMNEMGPAELDGRIDAAELELIKHSHARQALVDELDRLTGLRLQVEGDVAAEADALEKLNKARADSYLTPGNKAVTRAVSEAEDTLVKASEAATAARAAAGQIEATYHEAMEALGQHDAMAADLANRIATLRTTRALLVARDSINAAKLLLTNKDARGVQSRERVDVLGCVLVSLREAAPDEGKRLSDEWGRSLCEASDRLDRKLAPAVHSFVGVGV